MGENKAGKYLKIRETTSRGSNLVVLPLEGLETFMLELSRLAGMHGCEDRSAQILESAMQAYGDTRKSIGDEVSTEARQ